MYLNSNFKTSYFKKHEKIQPLTITRLSFHSAFHSSDHNHLQKQLWLKQFTEAITTPP